jgi:Neocarzinostatin family
MPEIDEALRSELQLSSSQRLDETRLWEDVSKRLSRRQHVRRVRRRALSVGLAVVLLAATAIGLARTQTSPGSPSHPALAIDPKAGSGGFSVTPSQGLLNSQRVRIAIHGLHPDSSIWITMCVGKPLSPEQGTNQCNAPPTMARLNSEGTLDVDFTVERFISLNGFRVDCSTYPSGCSIAVFDPLTLTNGKFVGNTEPVTFGPSPPTPPNPIQMSVSPTSPYEDGQQVTVSGSGFPANSSIHVGECPSNTDCGGFFQTLMASPQGAFSAVVTLHRTYTVEQGTAAGGETPVEIDCSQPLRCFLMAFESASPYAGASSIPLVFASEPSNKG